MDELIGRSDLLEADAAVDHWKARGVNLTNILLRPELPDGAPLHRVRPQEPVLDDALDWELVERARPALDRGEHVAIETEIRNVNRCVGGILSSHIATAHGAKGLAADTLEGELHGAAGQSFGGWLAPGVSFRLHGDANDYTGKGLSGGTLTVMPPDGASYPAEENVIIGNTVLYGATAGEVFLAGTVGERFAVRNSGASAVVEGVGDHGCEYMTAGLVVVLGAIGRNFGSGMSGGLAFVLAREGAIDLCNTASVDVVAATSEDWGLLEPLLIEHRRLTGSEQADLLLRRGQSAVAGLRKVLPITTRPLTLTVPQSPSPRGLTLRARGRSAVSAMPADSA